jgi:hypothetical protein
MRNQEETNALLSTKDLSLSNPGEHLFYTSKNEVFVLENGEIIGYTDKRVIDHDTDRLVNLAEEPYSDWD